jgi:hypothetical protein
MARSELARAVSDDLAQFFLSVSSSVHATSRRP